MTVNKNMKAAPPVVRGVQVTRQSWVTEDGAKAHGLPFLLLVPGGRCGLGYGLPACSYFSTA
jgi:hypothetical protein